MRALYLKVGDHSKMTLILGEQDKLMARQHRAS
jgi:hypothetical protein